MGKVAEAPKSDDTERRSRALRGRFLYSARDLGLSDTPQVLPSYGVAGLKACGVISLFTECGLREALSGGPYEKQKERTAEFNVGLSIDEGGRLGRR